MRPDIKSFAVAGHLLENVAWLREALGASPLMVTANRVALELSRGGIPHLIVGGLAVQEHGYVRTTVDVDVVVPDVDAARDYLSLRGFQEVPGTRSIVKDRQTKVTVDLLPGGGSVGPSVIPLPDPDVISPTPNYISIAGLISQKLSSYVKNPLRRAKDLGDVVELINAGNLPEDLPVEVELQEEYLRVWKGLHE